MTSRLRRRSDEEDAWGVEAEAAGYRLALGSVTNAAEAAYHFSHKRPSYMTRSPIPRMWALCLALVISWAWPNTTLASGSVLDATFEKYPLHISIARDGKVSQAGTGFYVDDGKYVFMVTANHIIYKKGQDTRWGETADVMSSDASHHLILDLNKLHAGGHIRSHALYDIVMIRVGEIEGSGSQYLNGIRDRSVNTKQPPSISTRLLTRFEEVETGNKFILSGYPSVLDHPRRKKAKLLSRVVELVDTFQAEHILLLKLTAYPGDSGAPIFQLVEKAEAPEIRIVGILTQVHNEIGGLPHHLKQIVLSYWFGCAMPVDSVLELVTSFSRGQTTDGPARGEAHRRKCPKLEGRFDGSTLSFAFKNKTFVVPLELSEFPGPSQSSEKGRH